MAENPVEQHPLMHFTREQMDEMMAGINASPKYSAPRRELDVYGDIPPGSRTLLPLLSYIPSERDQGQCGNCWVWASTGAMEIDHNVKTGIKERLSIQYFDSRYFYGPPHIPPPYLDACCGGTLEKFTFWYNAFETAVPWSNTNAWNADRYSQCGIGPLIPLNDISTKPNYSISSVNYSTIQTVGAGKQNAINNIKSALNENKAVVYGFSYGNNGWNSFNNFWGDSPETTIFDPRPYSGEINAGGHAVLIVGYDDTDPNNAYWIALNSWGVTPNRPNGLFRVRMDMNYDANIVVDPTQAYPQHIFQILDSSYNPPPAPQVAFTADPTTGMVPLDVQFMDLTPLDAPTRWDWSFGDGTHSSAKNPLHRYGTLGRHTVSLTVTNSSGSYTGTRTDYIFVTAPPLIPDFTANATSGTTPFAVAFSDASRNYPAGWAWFFGDETYTGPWTRLNASAGWTARARSSSVILPDGNIVLTGGHDGNRKNDTWRSSDRGMTWVQVNNSSGWTPREGHTMVALPDGRILLLGGFDDSIGYRNDVWSSADEGSSWALVSPSALWSPRWGHSAVLLPDGSIVLMGGVDSAGYTNDVWSSVDNGTSWTAV